MAAEGTRRGFGEAEAFELLRVGTPTIGVPSDMQLAPRPVVDDPERPDVLADVAAAIRLTRRGGRLVRAELQRSEPLLVCVVYGSLERSPDGRLGFATLTVGPLLTPRFVEPDELPELLQQQFAETNRGLWYVLDPEPAGVVSAALLRLVSPERILSEAVARLRVMSADFLAAARRDDRSLSASARTAAETLREAEPRTQARPTERDIYEVAQLYILLVGAGDRRPLPKIARRFGLTREQARDRVHRARDLGFLMKSKPGKLDARPGPRLQGWTPPDPPTEREGEDDGEPSG